MKFIESKDLRSIPFHPLVASVWPIIFLLSANIGVISVSSSIRSLLVSLVFTTVIWFLLTFLLSGIEKAAIITTLFLTIIFIYGHLYFFLHLDIPILATILHNHRYLFPLSIAIIIGSTYFIFYRSGDLRQWTINLNIVSVILLISPLFQIAQYQLSNISNYEFRTPIPPVEIASDLPDVYLIILDMYARGDFLEQSMGFDNSPFLNSLKERGFYIAECSLSNYSVTSQSVPSMLNMNYLPEIININSTNPILDLIPFGQNPSIRQFFESQGYTIVAFQTDFEWTQWNDADIFYGLDRDEIFYTDEEPQIDPSSMEFLQIMYENTWVGEWIINHPLNDFEWLLLHTTAFRIIPDYLVKIQGSTPPSPESIDNLRQYQLIRYVLEQANQAPMLPSPKFVFLHLIIPHPPLIFAADGSYANPRPVELEEETNFFNRRYIEQVQFINDAVLQLVDMILIESAQNLIIIQGDHGPYDFEQRDLGYNRNEILNAYRLSDSNTNSLYPSISPVNSFRIVLNDFFGVDMPLLEDQAYHVPWYVDPLAFERVYEVSPTCISP